MRPEPIEFKRGMPVKAFVRSGNRYPYHWHDALEIVQVLRGTVSIGLGDDELPLREGDIAITNMGEIHRMTGDGEDLEIGFNNRYMIDALKAAPADTVELRLNSPISPCIIVPADGNNQFLFMVLPVRLRAGQ